LIGPWARFALPHLPPPAHLAAWDLVSALAGLGEPTMQPTRSTLSA